MCHLNTTYLRFFANHVLVAAIGGSLCTFNNLIFCIIENSQQNAGEQTIVNNHGMMGLVTPIEMLFLFPFFIYIQVEWVVYIQVSVFLFSSEMNTRYMNKPSPYLCCPGQCLTATASTVDRVLEACQLRAPHILCLTSCSQGRRHASSMPNPTPPTLVV